MYIVIGANGYIGSYIVKNILEHTKEDVLAIGRHIVKLSGNQRVHCMQCDLTDRRDIEKLNSRLTHTENATGIYLAAYHHPDEVKQNPQTAWNVNVTALSDALNHLGNMKKMVYISTEMVYGEGSPEKLFSEKDELCPVNLYGRQKKVAEAVVLGYGFHVVRFPFVIGPSLLPDRKHFYDFIVEDLKNGMQVEMFEDAVKSALDFDTAAALVVQLCEKGLEKIPRVLNVSGDERLSKYEIGVRIAKKHHLDTRLIQPVRMQEDQKIFSETRAGYTLLDNSLLKSVLQMDEIKMRL